MRFIGSTAIIGAVAAAALIAPAAFAQSTTPAINEGSSSPTPEGHWYFSASTSLWNKRDQSTDIGAGTAAKFKDGWAFSGAAGYRRAIGKVVAIRLEAEVTEQNNRNKTFVAVGTNAFGVPVGTQQQSIGNVGLTSYMVNLGVDFRIPSVPRLSPYVGFGYGTYQSSINGFTTVNGALDTNGVVLSTKSLFTHCKQYRVGVNYGLDKQTELYLGWRRFDGDDLDFHFFVPPATVVPLKVTGGKTDNIEFGVRVKI